MATSYTQSACRVQEIVGCEIPKAVGAGSCYWNTGTNYAYCDGGACVNINRDGGNMQYQPFETQRPLIFQVYYPAPNIKYLQNQILQQGFNAAPSPDVLRDFMDQVYEDDMPYGAYNQLDPTREMGNVMCGQKPLNYVTYYVDRLNRQVLNKVVRNMAQMRESQKLYLHDLQTFRGVMQIDRPVSEWCASRGDQLRADFLLPQAYSERDLPQYHVPTQTFLPATEATQNMPSAQRFGFTY